MKYHSNGFHLTWSWDRHAGDGGCRLYHFRDATGHGSSAGVAVSSALQHLEFRFQLLELVLHLLTSARKKVVVRVKTAQVWQKWDLISLAASVALRAFLSASNSCICFSSSASICSDFLLSSSSPSAMLSIRDFSSDSIWGNNTAMITETFKGWASVIKGNCGFYTLLATFKVYEYTICDKRLLFSLSLSSFSCKFQCKYINSNRQILILFQFFFM